MVHGGGAQALRCARRPIFCHGLPRKRVVVHHDGFYIRGRCEWAFTSLNQCARNPDADGHLRSRSSTVLPNHERVRNQDGWCFHVFDFNNPAANQNYSEVDCIPRLRVGRCARANHRIHSVGSACVSTMGIFDKRCHTPRKSIQNLPVT